MQVNYDLQNRSLKSQLKLANKLGSKYVGILGNDELEKGIMLLKDMTTGEQVEIHLDQAEEYLIELVGDSNARIKRCNF